MQRQCVIEILHEIARKTEWRNGVVGKHERGMACREARCPVLCLEP
jgi:hypothetical protein